MEEVWERQGTGDGEWKGRGRDARRRGGEWRRGKEGRREGEGRGEEK